MFGSRGTAPDGLPRVDVLSAYGDTEGLLLAGTACVYEGTVLVCATHGDAPDGIWYAAQATVGAPERGTWSLHLPLPTLPADVLIGEDDAELGELAEGSRITLRVDPGGSVAEVPEV